MCLFCQMVEVFLVRPSVEQHLYPVAGIEPVLVLTSWTLALIYLHRFVQVLW